MLVCGDVQSHVGCAGNRCACVCVDACSGRTVGASGHWLTAVNTSTCNTPAKHLERVLSTSKES